MAETKGQHKVTASEMQKLSTGENTVGILVNEQQPQETKGLKSNKVLPLAFLEPDNAKIIEKSSKSLNSSLVEDKKSDTLKLEVLSKISPKESPTSKQILDQPEAIFSNLFKKNKSRRTATEYWSICREYYKDLSAAHR